MVRVPDTVTFLSQDLHLLESVEFKQRIKHVADIIEEVTWENVDPDTLMRFLFTHTFRFYIHIYIMSGKMGWAAELGKWFKTGLG